jgi:mycothiol synthase
LTPEDVPLADPLLRNGFHRTTALWYLRHDLTDIPTVIHRRPTVGDVTYTTFATVGPDLFAAILGRTYEGTQDCPEISDARTPPEALTAHMAEGFDPNHWWLAAINGEPAGLLLINPAVDGDGWEIAYVGVVPKHRRRGLGRELVLKALLEAKAAGEPQVMLAVDARNRPARELYRGLGFEAHESREVLLAVWG